MQSQGSCRVASRGRGEPCGLLLGEEVGGEAGTGCGGWGRAEAGMLQLLFSKAAPRVPGLRLLADLIRCDKAA